MELINVVRQAIIFDLGQAVTSEHVWGTVPVAHKHLNKMSALVT